METAVGGNGLKGLVNNAASATFGPVETIPMTEVEREFAVNVIAPCGSRRPASPCSGGPADG